MYLEQDNNTVARVRIALSEKQGEIANELLGHPRQFRLALVKTVTVTLACRRDWVFEYRAVHSLRHFVGLVDVI